MPARVPSLRRVQSGAEDQSEGPAGHHVHARTHAACKLLLGATGMVHHPTRCSRRNHVVRRIDLITDMVTTVAVGRIDDQMMELRSVLP